MDFRINGGKEFSIWYGFAVEMDHPISMQPSHPQMAKCWSKYWNNVDHDSPESYYRRSITIPFLDNIVSQVRYRVNDRSYAESFRLIPSVMFEKDYSIKEPCLVLLKKIQT